MKRILWISVLIFLLACNRDEPVPVSLTLTFSRSEPTTIDITQFRAHLAGPANLDTSGFVYRWDWETDQIWDTRYSAVPWVTKNFKVPGEFMVTVEALTADGILLTASGLLKVVQGFSAPKPDFTFTPDSGNYKTIFTFDAGLTVDAQDSLNLLTFSWDFNNDQHFEVVQKGNPVAQYQFSGEGTYQVNLLVTDPSKLWGRAQKELTVNRIDTLIVPKWLVTPEYPSDLDTVHFNAGGSYYTENPQLPLRFSWKQPRGAWTEPSESPYYNWVRPAEGSYLVRLRVYAPDNLYNEKEFEVLISRANKKPTARVIRNMRFGNILSVFEFDAWGSSDPENIPSELKARWDFDGDGYWDTPFDYVKKVTRVYQEPGVYQVNVEIMDVEGLRDMATTDIHVSGYTNPTSTMKDVRDEQIYGIVQIGMQWWMGENLNWDMRQNGFGNQYPTYCFNENRAICDITGRLYYAATIESDFTGESETRNICPRGWHLPTVDEWLVLLKEVGSEDAGTALNYGGRSDFNILLGGYAAYHHYGEFTEFVPDSLYKVSYFITAPINGTVRALQYKRNDTKVQFRDMTGEGYYSVRCVKDR